LQFKVRVTEKRVPNNLFKRTQTSRAAQADRYTAFHTTAVQHSAGSVH